MARRRRAVKRKVTPDSKYGDVTVSRLVSKVMMKGKKTLAQRIVYDALEYANKQTKQEPVQILMDAVKNASPLLRVKPRRVGGATYQVPVEVEPDKGNALAIRWIISSARAREGEPMSIRLAKEIVEASRGQGVAVKRREDTHKMAEANRAFVHYRW